MSDPLDDLDVQSLVGAGDTAGHRPIYLFADSQPLFWKPPGGDRPFLHRLRRELPAEGASAAYIGAANDDDPAFYGIFEAAMESIGITDRRLIRSQLEVEDEVFLETADLVLLAGGDVARGWRVIEDSGMREILSKRAFEGLVLAGVSAGAVHLGWLGAGPDPPTRDTLVDPLKLVPAIIGVHEEADEWRTLRRLMRLSDVPVRGLGIPTGGGLIYHPDQSVEPVRHPVVEVIEEDGRLKPSLLLPPEEGGEAGEAGATADDGGDELVS